MERPYDKSSVYEVHILGLGVGAAMALAEKIAADEQVAERPTTIVVWRRTVARWRRREFIASYGGPPR